MRSAIVIFPGGVKKNGTLPFFIRAVLDRAYYVFQQVHPDYIIVSGKQNLAIEDVIKITEAEAMAAYLLKLGVPKDKILLERKSRDLISGFYHVKEDFIEPQHIKELYIITSQPQKERLEYISGKVLGLSLKKHIFTVNSTLAPKVLWEFFTYERNMLIATKTFLHKMKPGDHTYLIHRFYSAPFYSSNPANNPQKMVYDNRVGKKSNIHKHYSLTNIFKKKEELFKKYSLTESKFHRGSKVDFWSGRYLPFVGRSQNKTIHVLKFALLQKDKKKFENEIKITQFLKKKGTSFTPTIIDYNTKSAPIWYLYKAMPGKIAGRFSSKFSFEEDFYREYVLKGCISHLKKLRKLGDGELTFPKWNKARYEDHFVAYFKNIERYDPKLAASPVITKAREYFLKNTALFDKAPVYLSHNDLHPANILISPRSQKVHLIDFEHVAFNSLAFDFCFLYIFSWDNTFFQQKLYSTFRKSLEQTERDSFDQVFYPTYCCFLIWLLAFVLIWEGRAEKERFQKARAYILAELKRLPQTNNASSLLLK